MKPFNMARRGAIAAIRRSALRCACALPQFAAAQACRACSPPAASGKTEILWLGRPLPASRHPAAR